MDFVSQARKRKKDEQNSAQDNAAISQPAVTNNYVANARTRREIQTFDNGNALMGEIAAKFGTNGYKSQEDIWNYTEKLNTLKSNINRYKQYVSDYMRDGEQKKSIISMFDTRLSDIDKVKNSLSEAGKVFANFKDEADYNKTIEAIKNNKQYEDDNGSGLNLKTTRRNLLLAKYKELEEKQNADGKSALDIARDNMNSAKAALDTQRSKGGSTALLDARYKQTVSAYKKAEKDEAEIAEIQNWLSSPERTSDDSAEIEQKQRRLNELTGTDEMRRIKAEADELTKYIDGKTAYDNAVRLNERLDAIKGQGDFERVSELGYDDFVNTMRDLGTPDSAGRERNQSETEQNIKAEESRIAELENKGENATAEEQSELSTLKQKQLARKVQMWFVDQYTTDDERKIFNYIRNTEGEKAAAEYVDQIADTLNMRRGIIEGERDLKNVSAAARIAASFGLGAAEGASGMITAPKTLFGGNDDIDTREQLSSSADEYKQAYMRGQISDEDVLASGVFNTGDAGADYIGKSNKIGSVQGALVDMAGSVGNMVPSIAISIATSGAASALGAASKAADTAGKIAGSAAFGASIFDSSYKEARKEGYSREQALMYGGVQAALESVTSYTLGGISKLGGKVSGAAWSKITSNISNAALRAGAELGGSMISEGLEEYIQAVAEPFIRNSIFNENNEIDPLSGDKLYQGLIGALTAGILESPGAVSKGARYKQLSSLGNSVKGIGAVESFKDIAERSSASEDIKSAVRKLTSNSTDINIGEAVNEFTREVTKNSLEKVANRLFELGVSKEKTDQYAGYIVDSAFVPESSPFNSLYNKNKAFRTVADEFKSGNLGGMDMSEISRIGGYALQFSDNAKADKNKAGKMFEKTQQLIRENRLNGSESFTDGTTVSEQNISAPTETALPAAIESVITGNNVSATEKMRAERLESFSKEQNYNRETQAAMIGSFDGSVDSTTYTNEWNTVYRQAKQGTPPSEILRQPHLTDEQTRSAIEAGVASAEKEQAIRDVTAENTKLIDAAKKLGTEVVFEDTLDTDGVKSDGYIDENGVIHIDYESKNPWATVFKHELTHYAERAKEKYADFAEAVRKTKTYGKWVAEHAEGDTLTRGEANLRAKIIKEYRERGVRISPGEAQAEIIANFVQDTLFSENGTTIDNLLKGLDKKQRSAVAGFIQDFINWIKNKLSGKNIPKEIIMLERKFNNALNGAKSVDGEGKIKYKINPDFESEYDIWDKKNQKKTFIIGTTSSALQKIGLKNTTITWDSAKIIKIKSRHPEMTDTVIKQVPEILEHPIIIMKSKTAKGRITLFGEVFANNKPVLAVLVLSPADKNGLILDEYKIASAYGKDNAQNLINTSEIIYIDKNKKRISEWEKRTRLQLPVGFQFTNSNNTVPQNDTVVKTYYAQNSKNDTKNFSDTSNSGKQHLIPLDNGRAKDVYGFEVNDNVDKISNNRVFDVEDDTAINDFSKKTDSERANIIRNTTIDVVEFKDDKAELSGKQVLKLKSTYKSEAQKILKELAKKFGVFKDYSNDSIELEFNYSRGSLNESTHKQNERNADFYDFAKMLYIFDDVIKNAQPIESHTDKYRETKRENKNINQVFVLLSAFRDGNYIIPVEFNIKEFNKGVKNQLYVSVTLKKIEADLMETLSNQKSSVGISKSTSNYSITELIKNVNPTDEEFLKYIPDELLSDKQKQGKSNAVKREKLRIDNLKYEHAVKNNPEKARQMLKERAEQNGYSKDTDWRMDHKAPNADDETAHNIAELDKAYGGDGSLYSPQAVYYYGEGRSYDSKAIQIIRSVRNKPNAMVKIYRAVPTSIKDTRVRNGDWVAIVKDYAVEHAERILDGKYRIIENTVPAKFLFNNGDSINEFGYDNGNRNEVYKNTAANVKLDEITYDDNGNIIPLSQRFNSENSNIRYSLPLDESRAEDTQESIVLEATKLTKQYQDGEITAEEYAEKQKELWNTANDRYGSIPKGEKPKADIDVPKTVDGKHKTQRFARTALEADITDAETTNRVMSDILTGKLAYQTATDEAAVRYAENALKNGTAENLWAEAYANGKFDKNTIATGEALLRIYAESHNTEKFTEMLAELAELGRTAGQAVQAFSLLKKMDGVSQLTYAKKTVDRLNKDLMKRFKNKSDIPRIELNPVMAEQLANSKTQKDFEVTYDAIMQDIADQLPATFTDKFNAWRYFSMLGNTRTHIRNIVGNAIFTPAVRTKDVVGTVLEKTLPKDRRTKAVKVKKEYKAYAEADFDNVVDILCGNGKYNISDDIRRRQQIFRSEVLRWLNKLIKLNSNALEAEDLFFLKRHYKHALGSFLQARDIDLKSVDSKKLFAAREYAIKEAQKATFRDASAAAYALNRLSRSSLAANIAVEGLLPFKKTPINVMKRGLEYSPLGLIETLTRQTYKLKKREISASEYIDRLASGLTGTGISAIGALAQALGLISVGFGSDDEDRFKQLNGEQEYAIRIGDISFTVDWAAPAAIPFFVGAEAWKAFDDDEYEMFPAFVNAMLAVASPITNLSMLSGLDSTLKGIAYGTDSPITTAMLNTIQSFAGQFVPTLFGQIARTADTTRRRNYIDKNSSVPEFFQKLWNQTAGKTPGLSMTKEPYVDEWGQVDEGGSRIWAAVENFISPGYFSEVNYDKTNSEIQRLYNEIGDKNVFPSLPDKYVTVGGVRKDLTASEYTEYAKEKGQKSKKAIDDLVNSASYENMKDVEKAEAIKWIYSYYNALAKTKVSDYELSSSMNTAMLLEEAGVSAADQAIVNAEINKAEDEKAERTGKNSATLTKAETNKIIREADVKEYCKEILIAVNALEGKKNSSNAIEKYLKSL